MRTIVLRRIVALLPTALLGSLIIFGIVHFTPGGPAAAIAGPDAGPEVIARINHELGLDRPIAVQFGSWVWNLAHGDFGRSLINREYVSVLIAQRLPVTATLAAEALLIALIVGVPLGVYAAVRRGTTTDTAIKTLSGLTHAFPEFWVGIMAISLFALQLAWVPATGFVPLSAGLHAHLLSVVLPASTLALGPCSVIVRFTRSSMVEALSGGYIRTAWALGLKPWQIYWRFALKNALIPIVTVTGIVTGALVGGAVLVERVFAIPGVGDLLAEGVLQKDFPVVQGATILMMGVVILINLLVDIACALLDPRTRAS
jgi:peptide/nickel transport system permease protein